MRLCVFCGSYTGNNPEFAEHARCLGLSLVQRGLGLVFGGGHIGLMGVVADAVLAGGGEVIGVIPRALVDRELAHSGVADMRIVGTMHERKALMADQSDAFLALPGGFGTADEVFEMLTWAQLKIHAKPIGFLNSSGYFDPLFAWIDRAVADGFIQAKHRALVRVQPDVEPMLDALFPATAVK
ncbi:MAG: TIGR00730 family Rossman fold protein [Gemmataceae bacterium]|nr:TIGR00730 family Rossman fold protein [Gemmataceae bacterium]MCI0738099.1 TIGR00730 family Rossman fold protein [Gemmataceae bacterium]